MIKWVVRDVAERSGIRNARELARRANIHLNTAYGVWNGTLTRVGLETIDRLCTLLEVKPSQILYHYLKSDAAANTSEHQGPPGS